MGSQILNQTLNSTAIVPDKNRCATGIRVQGTGVRRAVMRVAARCAGGVRRLLQGVQRLSRAGSLAEKDITLAREGA